MYNPASCMTQNGELNALTAVHAITSFCAETGAAANSSVIAIQADSSARLNFSLEEQTIVKPLSAVMVNSDLTLNFEPLNF